MLTEAKRLTEPGEGSAAGYDLDWNLIRTFVSVVENGSLSAAARRLDASHPTVARHIQQLEAQLDVRLFERTAAGLKINEAGRRLAEVACRMRKDAMTFESVSAAIRTSAVGKVRITIAELLVDMAPQMLIPLQDFAGSGERQIELIVSSRQLNLLEGEADLAIRHVRPVQSELVCRRVGSLPMAAYAAPDYIRQHGMPNAENADRHWFVDGVTEAPFSMGVARLGCRIPQNRVVFRTDSLRAQLRAVEAGWGIAALPTYLARQAGLSRVMADASPAAATDVWLVGRPGVRQQALPRMVFQHLAEALYEHFSGAEPQF